MGPKSIWGTFNAAVLAGILTLSGIAFAQKATVPDATVQANVLRAMANEPKLANQQINTSTVFGTVTLTGSVPDEASRDLAEQIASHAEGVKKVVDQLSVGTAPAPATSDEDQRAASVIPPPAVADGGPQPDQPQPDQQQMQGPDQAQAQHPMDGDQGQQQPRRRMYRRQYQQQMSQQQGGGQQYGAYPQGNPGGVSVVIPSGTPVQVRLNHWLSSGQVEPGTGFDGFIAMDVVSGGQIALPRGAAVQGTVLDVKRPGALAGSGSITLQLQTVTLAGKVYPLQSDPWTINGHDKTGHTVGNTAVMGILGALIGGAAGGGAGALIGAGAGSAAGLGVSAAQGGGNAVIPGEATVDFRLQQPTNIVTVSDAEMARLGNYAGPATDGRRRPYAGGPGYPPPVGVYFGAPYPYYYGGYYYRRPYYYGRYYHRW